MTLPTVTRKSENIAASDEGFLLLIDKNEDWTSFDVCKKVRNIVGVKKVGHSGTLDPFATGLLILGIGKGTKQLNDLIGLDKSYRATIHFGISTDSYDKTGKVIFEKTDTKRWPSAQEVEQVLKEMTGDMMQVPPMFSAKKVAGKRLYKSARKGIDVERPPQSVTVYESQLEEYEPPFLTVKLRVSKGTYIRSYAVDMAEKLGEAAHLSALRRLEVGEYSVQDAFRIDEFADAWKGSVS